MKNLLFLVLILPSIAMINADQDLNNINNAFNRGDAKALAQYFDQRVDIAILDDENTYDKAGAEQAIGSFFTKHKPQSFKSVHKGASKNADSQYSIGDLSTSSGNYRVYVYMKVTAANYTIQEIRVDRK